MPWPGRVDNWCRDLALESCKPGIGQSKKGSPEGGCLVKMAGVLPGIVALGMAVLLGALIADSVPLPIPVELPPVALFAAVLIVAALPLLIGRWTLTLGILLVWLVVEDLVRKLAGNNLAVYFVKDLIYLVLLFGLFSSASFLQA